MTGQEVYQIYNRECLMEKNKMKFPPRQISDFSNYEKKDTREFFERVAQMKERSGDMLNVDLYVQALAKQYKGFFPPKMLVQPSAMKIYRLYLDSLNAKKDPDDIAARVVSDLSFITNFCRDQKLTTFEDYLNHNSELIPSIILHAYTGKISYFMLACIDVFPLIVQNYPSDSRELIADFEYKLFRSKIIFIPKCRTISDNLYRIIQVAITKQK